MSRRIAKWIFPSALMLASLASATVVTALADDALAPKQPRPIAPGLGQRQSTHAKPVSAPTQPSTQHLYLIRTTLLTLDTANRTGNYTVLRDSAGPTFQQKHSSADLALAFQKVRGSLDLAPIALAMPQLTRPPITTAQQLQLAGIVPSDSTPIAFEMMFEPIGGHWRLAALAVGAVQPARAK